MWTSVGRARPALRLASGFVAVLQQAAYATSLAATCSRGSGGSASTLCARHGHRHTHALPARLMSRARAARAMPDGIGPCTPTTATTDQQCT